MPILDLQRRLVEVGRIRLGAKKTSQNGKEYPAKLEQFRLTSRDRQRLDAAAALYGGTVRQWGDEWELFTEANAIPIAVVPGQALTQSYEQWGQKTRGTKKTAVICLRRCDGVTEQLTGGACLCQGEPEMSCKPTTRLSVVLTEVPGLGVWRLESHGWNAAAELAGGVELLEALVASGRPVRARLRLDKREQKTENETRQFVVPVLDIDHTLGQVLDSIGAGPPLAVAPPGAPTALPAAPALKTTGFKPVPAELPAAPAPSIAEQVAGAGQEQARAPRRGAAEPIRPTGIRPRAANEVSDAAAGSSDEGPVAGETGMATLAPATDPTDPEDDFGRAPTLPDPTPEEDPAGLQRAQQVAIWCREASDVLGVDADEWRHQFLKAFSNGVYESAKSVPQRELAGLRAATVRVRRGELVLAFDQESGRPKLMNTTFGFETTDPAGEHAKGDRTTEAVVDWASELASTPGTGEVRFLNRARKLAHELGLDPNINSESEIVDPRLVEALLSWLRERRGAAA